MAWTRRVNLLRGQFLLPVGPEFEFRALIDGTEGIVPAGITPVEYQFTPGRFYDRSLHAAERDIANGFDQIVDGRIQVGMVHFHR